MNPLLPTRDDPSETHAKAPQKEKDASVARQPMVDSSPVSLALPDTAGSDGRNWHPYVPNKQVDQWTMMGYMLGWDETSRRCANESTTFGVVSALLAGVTFPALLSPLEDDGTEADGPISKANLLRMYMYFLAFSVLSSLMCVVTSMMIIMALNIATNSLHIRDFFDRYWVLPAVVMVTFNVSIFCFFAAMAVVMAVKYQWKDMLIMTSVVALMYGIVGPFAAHLYWAFSLAHISENYQAFIGALARMQRAAHKLRPPGAPSASSPAAAAAVVSATWRQRAKSGKVAPSGHDSAVRSGNPGLPQPDGAQDGEDGNQGSGQATTAAGDGSTSGPDIDNTRGGESGDSAVVQAAMQRFFAMQRQQK